MNGFLVLVAYMETKVNLKGEKKIICDVKVMLVSLSTNHIYVLYMLPIKGGLKMRNTDFALEKVY